MASTRDLVLAPCTRRRPRRTGRRERPHLTHVFDELQSRVIEQQVRTGEDRKQRRKLSRVPGACDFLLNLLSYGEEVLSELICHIILREGDHSWEDKGRGTCPHFALREDAEKDLGAPPWGWGLPEQRGQVTGTRWWPQAAGVHSPGRAPAAPWASCDGWLAPLLLTGVLPGALRPSSSCRLWYTATMYAVGQAQATGFSGRCPGHPRDQGDPGLVRLSASRGRDAAVATDSIRCV